MPTRFQIALPDIKTFFDQSPPKIYAKKDLSQILTTHRSVWRLAESMTANDFINQLLKNTKLRAVKITCRDDTFFRYSWGKPHPYSVALSIRKGAYLSHATAVLLHGLNDQVPKTVFINKEQSPKPQPSGELTQQSIDRAFSNKQRTSNYYCEYDNTRCLLLSGKNTNRLEVSTLYLDTEESLSVTNLERTLIDIAVRPVYAGGVFQVLEAYRASTNKLSLNTLIVTLKRLDYRYPYHQAIGFYLTRAGVSNEKLKRLKKLGIHFDFYIDYGLKDPEYDQEWRLYYPKSL